MSRSPNEEQLLAINKMDGVLLSAGAGSGKTFVIIEHIIKRILIIKDQIESSRWNEDVGSELSKIVLMTFTKKASGEMSVRLLNRVEELINESPESEAFWRIVNKNLNRIQVSTIHGFCHRLLGFGFWPELPSEIELLSDFTHKEKIRKLFKKWLKINKSKLSSLYLSHTSDLFNAMVNIFSSPELRIMWERGNEKSDFETEISLFWKEWNKVKNYSSLFGRKPFLIQDKKKIEKKSYAFLCDFFNLIEKDKELGPHNYKKIINFIELTAKFPMALKDFSDEENEFRLEIKKIFDDLKGIKNDLVAMEEQYSVYIEWESTLQKVYKFINENYLSIPGFSFSDLEYYTLIGLSSGVSNKKILEMFTCFVVDEFQDTSTVQFEIINLLIGGDFTKLFCVGDKKQAIYGFRGGELAVFSECAKRIGEKSILSLRTNYRSCSAIVNFNNDFFNKVLPSGIKYEGKDSHSVEMEFQLSPDGIQRFGDVLVSRVDLDSNEEESIDIDFAEANIILDMIKSDLLDEKIHSIAVLYRKLRPSRHLIDLLRIEKMSFTSQVKIKFEDDPIISFFRHAVLYVTNFEDQKKRSVSEFQLHAISELIGIKLLDSFLLEKFYRHYKILGLSAAFWKLIYSLGISNSSYNECASFIENVISLAENDIFKVNNSLQIEDGNYSTEFISGTGKPITIMSTHASKGLEFDSVIIGGIHRNGSYEGMRSKVGKIPKSFQWKKNYNQKKYYKSPFFHLESEITAQKDFSESKRLFYVANTRAVKRLRWAEILINGKESASFANSWVNAFRKFGSNEGVEFKKTEPIFNTNSKDISLIQKDSLGILPTNCFRKLGVISELSVTRLSLLVQCPFKFYLKNICKIEEEIIFDEEETDDEKFFSSKKRGSRIHKELSDVVLNLKNPDSEMSSWVQLTLKNTGSLEIISEKEMKFSFFGQMITAIPDLILIQKNKIVIWDFKTGSREEMDEDAYWFQLSAYAYGYSLLNSIDQEYEFELSLLYLDQKDLISKRLKLKDIIDYLYSIWEKTNCLDQVNVSHCRFCNYSNICKSSSVVASI